MSFKERLKALRLEQGYTQAQLGEQIGVTYGAIQRYENGRVVPSQGKLKKLTQVLNVSADYLLGESDVKSSTEVTDLLQKLDADQINEVVTIIKNMISDKESQNNLTSTQSKRFEKYKERLRQAYSKANISIKHFSKKIERDEAVFVHRENYLSELAQSLNTSVEYLLDAEILPAYQVLPKHSQKALLSYAQELSRHKEI